MGHDSLEMIEYGDDPAVLICADNEEGLERARSNAERTGCRVAAAELLGSHAILLDRFAGADPILARLDGTAREDEAAALLDRLLDEAQRRGRRSVVVAAAQYIDLVAARAWHRDIEHQCEPDDAQQIIAIVAATRAAPTRLEDVGRESNALLQQLSEEVSRIANILATMSEEGEAAAAGGAKAGGLVQDDEPPVPAAFVRSIIRARRLRDQYFRSDLFADPAWDMLLDLIAARLEGNRVAVSSLCIAAAVPATTALRWIKALTDRGLFIRSADPEDGRRVYIGLSDEAARSLGAYLRAVQRLSTIAV